MIALGAIPIMAGLSRLCGWGGAPKALSGVPKILWGLAIAIAVAYHTDSALFFLIAWVWSWFFMKAGHGNAYHDGTEKDAFPDRFQKPIDYVARPVCNLLKWEIRGTAYCRLFMGFKGLMIGLPLFPFGLALAVAWPLAYAISFRVLKQKSMPAEWMSGAAAGLAISAGVYFG
jgi:hypothetical protein